MSGKTGRTCKITRIAEKYGIKDMNERLVMKREEEQLSLRDIEEYIGISILRRSMEQSDMEFIEGDAERYYRLLTNDNNESIAVDQVRRRFREAGIDVDAILSDVPSYQTIRIHLSERLEIDTSGRKGVSPDPSEMERTIRAMIVRSERVMKKSLRRLREHGIRNFGPIEIDIAIHVTCAECGNTYGIYKILREGCGCAD